MTRDEIKLELADYETRRKRLADVRDEVERQELEAEIDAGIDFLTMLLIEETIE